MNIRTITWVVVIGMLYTTTVFAVVPNIINLQGTLTDSCGNPIDGIRTIQFSLYSDSVGGIPLWNELHWSVSIEDGLFRVLLGSATSFPSSSFEGNARWLGIQVSPDATELSPRQKIVSIAYSLKAGTADDADMVDGHHYSPAWEPDGYNPDNSPEDTIRGEPTWNEVSNRDYGRSGVTDTLYEGTRRLSELYVNENQANSITSNMIQDSTILFRDIGQNGASTNQVIKWSGTGWTASNDVSGTIALPYSDSLSSILSGFTVTNTNLGNAIYGRRTYSGATNYGYLGGAYGVYGQQSTGNKGYLGGASYGVYGYHQSTGNWGDLGDANYGVYGRHSSTNEGYLGSSTVGVYGKEGTTNNFGYLGGASLGAYGKNMSSNNYGQLGATLYGVYGYATGASRDGVFGSHSSGNYGYLADDYFGVYGRYQTTGNYGYIGSSDFGVYGINVSTNNFGYFGGTVGAYGRHYATGNYGYLGGDSSGVYARCSTTSNNMCAVRAENTGRGDGVYATVTGTTGSSAVKAEALAGTPSNSYAVEAVNYGSGGGVYAKCQTGGYALQATGDSYLDGDVRVKDTLTVDDAIRGNQDSLVVHGNLTITGGLNTGFPRPDYVSEWVRMSTGTSQAFYHDLGGNPQDYVVDLQMMEDSDGTLNNFGMGLDRYYLLGAQIDRGAYWEHLDSQMISVHKGDDANNCDSLRVRIWVIK